MWRNWQTRRSQKPVMVTSWRFKSSHPHHEIKKASLTARLLSKMEMNPRIVLAAFPQLPANYGSRRAHERTKEHDPSRVPRLIHRFNLRQGSQS